MQRRRQQFRESRYAEIPNRGKLFADSGEMFFGSRSLTLMEELCFEAGGGAGKALPCRRVVAFCRMLGP